MGVYGGGGGGGSAPKPDPNIGKAALLSAETGQQALEWMASQAEITNEWAATDRERQQSVFVPLQDDYIADAKAGPDYTGVQADVNRATADVRSQMDLARQQERRQLTAMGVNPKSGRSMEASRRTGLTGAMASASAANTTRLASRNAAEAEADMKLTNAINMGSGLGVNPATSMSLSNSAGSSGFGAAMSGYGQQGSLLNTQYQGQLQSWNANKQAAATEQAGLWGGLGSMAGLGASALMMSSSKDYKENKAKPKQSLLDAVNEMPVEEWSYKKGIADGGAHVGPYAEDFQKATGKGDGKSIPVVDAIGTLMGAVQELDAKVSGMSKEKRA